MASTFESNHDLPITPFNMVLHLLAPLAILAARELAKKVNKANSTTATTHTSYLPTSSGTSSSNRNKYDPQPELKGCLHLEGDYDSDDEDEDDEVKSYYPTILSFAEPRTGTSAREDNCYIQL